MRKLKNLNRKATLVVAHRYVEVADSIIEMLYPNKEVLGIYTSQTDLMKGLDKEPKTRIALVDPEIAPYEPITLFGRLKRDFRRTRFVAVTTLPASIYGPRMIDAGTRGFIQYPMNAENLEHAINRVNSGEVYLEGLESRFKSLDIRNLGIQGLSDILSSREREVLQFLADGVVSAEIARRLGLSVKTVETHAENMKQKLGGNISQNLLRYHAARILRPERVFEPEKLSGLVGYSAFETLKLLSAGNINTSEIAEQIHLSPKTINTHLENIKSLFGFASFIELIVYLPSINTALANLVQTQNTNKEVGETLNNSN